MYGFPDGSVTAGKFSGVQIGVTDMSSGNVVTASGMGAVEEGDQVTVDVNAVSNMMENIETERVPCPRLCGASFSPGNGGLAIFHNGDVKKMWHWYKRADNVRGVPGLKGDAAFADSESLGVVSNASVTTSTQPPTTQTSSTANQQQGIPRSGPKTLKELINMTSTAKKVRETILFWASTDPISNVRTTSMTNFACRHNGGNAMVPWNLTRKKA